MSAAVVFAAAPIQPTPRLTARLAQLEHPEVVAADAGAATALEFGLKPDVVIGDLDSLQGSTLAQLRQWHVPIETYPRDKDQTDGQLAIERALSTNPSELLLVGFLGGPRLDQWLANILFLTRVETRATLLDGSNECVLLRAKDRLKWKPEQGEIVSLVPLSAEVSGITTRGLRWSLDGESLRLGDTRGVSNEPIAEQVSVETRGGLLIVTRHFPR